MEEMDQLAALWSQGVAEASRLGMVMANKRARRKTTRTRMTGMTDDVVVVGVEGDLLGRKDDKEMLSSRALLGIRNTARQKRTTRAPCSKSFHEQVLFCLLPPQSRKSSEGYVMQVEWRVGGGYDEASYG